MRKPLSKIVFLGIGLSLSFTSVGRAEDSFENAICFRFYEQWKVEEKNRESLRKQYKIICLLFDKKGKILMEKLSPTTKIRFTNLYNQCMRDGCLFCDANEGSCEEGTCGPHNSSCKPYMKDGHPLCGEDCGYYALRQL